MILAFKLVDLVQIPFGYLLSWLNQLTTNYGLALIIFAIVLKLILLPATAKGKKSTMKMSRLTPKLQALQKKYAGDQQKLNEATQALYKEEGVSMGGGCLWSFVPLLILIPLYTVVRQPITYMLHESAEVAEQNDPTIAAIASGESAEKFGLKPLAEGINQSQINTTRFAVLSRSENRNISKQHGAHFILVFTVRNEAGSLAQALNVIGSYGFNMRTLRSRPMGELLWQYYFYVEAEGNIHSDDGEKMLKRLRVYCDKVKCVGSFT